MHRLVRADLSSTTAIAAKPSPTTTHDQAEMGVSWLASKNAPPTSRAHAAVSKTPGHLGLTMSRV
jgi:hypothetical protein